MSSALRGPKSRSGELSAIAERHSVTPQRVALAAILLVEHCREVDIATAPLRDCISYYNGEGKASPGSLAYYGGRQWDKYRMEAQTTLEPYVFGGGDSAISATAK